MKKIVLTCAALALVASTAFASGVDLTVIACPGNAGASNDAGSLDCAGGQVVTMLATFLPNEALSDLVGIDVVYMVNVAGDISSDANFWDFASNANAAGALHTKPSTGCSTSGSNYTATWSPSGSGAGSLGVYPVNTGPNYPSNVSRIVALAYRPTTLSVTANQKLFGMQLSIDASNSAEGGNNPTALGCTKAATVTLSEVIPRALSGNDGSSLNTTALQGQAVTFNGGTAPVATHKKTWGQLKSLYR